MCVHGGSSPPARVEKGGGGWGGSPARSIVRGRPLFLSVSPARFGDNNGRCRGHRERARCRSGYPMTDATHPRRRPLSSRLTRFSSSATVARLMMMELNGRLRAMKRDRCATEIVTFSITLVDVLDRSELDDSSWSRDNGWTKLLWRVSIVGVYLFFFSFLVCMLYKQSTNSPLYLYSRVNNGCFSTKNRDTYTI